MLLSSILSQRDILADVFVNYDCRVGYSGILEQTLDSLLVVIKSTYSPDSSRSVSVSEQRILQQTTLETFYLLLSCCNSMTCKQNMNYLEACQTQSPVESAS